MSASTTARAGVSVQVSEGFSELSQLRPAWQRLFGSRGHEPSTSFEWTQAMVRHHLRASDRGFLIRLEREGELIGVLPLVRRQVRLLGRRLSLLMPITEEYNTHSDILLAAADADAVDAIVQGLIGIGASWDCFRMARLLDENPLLPLFRRALDAGRHPHSVRTGLAAYVLDLPASYPSYLAARSAKFRNHLKRAERKLASAGAVEIHRLSTAGAFERAFEALLEVERASWKQAHGSSITAVEHQPAFYRELACGALEAGRLHLQWLTLDGRPIAYNLGYLTTLGYHYLKTSYDHQSRQLGAATVLRAKLIESLIAEGTPRLDFPGEPYEWESQWTSAARRRVVLSLFRPTVQGRVLWLIDRVRSRMSRRVEIAHVDPRASRRPARESTEAAA